MKNIIKYRSTYNTDELENKNEKARLDNQQKNVDHPSHYQSGKIEAIDVIEDFNLGFCLGNVIKYVLRAGKKKEPGKSVTESEVQDLEKAEWYLSREIKTLRTAFSMDSSSEKPAEKEILYGP